MLGGAVAGPRAARAQAAGGAAPASATEVATAFFDALANQRWRDAVAYVDTAAFEMVRRDALASVWRQRAAGDMTADRLRQYNPTISRAEAKEFVRTMRQTAAHADDVVGMQFAHVPTADSLQRLPTSEAAARWLEAHDERFEDRQERDARRARGCAASPGDAALDRPHPRTVLGAVVLGDTIAYVLHEQPEQAAR